MESNTCTEQTQIEVGLFFPVESLYGYLEQIQDQRAARGVRYALTPILTLIVLAKMAEQSTLQAIAEWLHERRHAFQRLFRLQRRTLPHRTTLGRMLARAVPVEQLERVVSAFLAQLPRPEQTEYVLTLDGKTLRGTLDRSTGHQEHLLAAYLPHEGVVLVQVQVHQKQNEISAAPQVLAAIDLRGAIVTGDALLAQRALSIQIVAAGGDYLWKLKGGGATVRLREEVETLFASPTCPPGTSAIRTDFRTATTVEKGHGRKERRTLTTSQMLNTYSDWPHLGQVYHLERVMTDLPTGKVTTEHHYGITSLTPDQADPARLLRLVRLHWQVENGLHYRRDVTLEEDACRVRTGQAAQVLATLNNVIVALLHHQQPQRSLPSAQRYYAAHLDQAAALLLTPFA